VSPVEQDVKFCSLNALYNEHHPRLFVTDTCITCTVRQKFLPVCTHYFARIRE